MRTPSPHRTLVSILAAAALLSLGACKSEVDQVDQVQTNLVEKAIFEGEWWYSSTVIDVDFDEAAIFGSSGNAPFEGSMSRDLAVDYNRGGPNVIGSPSYSYPIARIRWVIDEDLLFAYRSFELVAGGNDDGRSPEFRGQPIAVFAIESHVDIRQDYSSVTGEETNTRVENTSDRRWYEREYMRVDWSQNLVADFVINSVTANELGAVFFKESTPFFVQDGAPGYPDSYQPSFVRVSEEEDYRFLDEWPEDQREAVHYMSFVTQEAWSPGGGCLQSGGGVCASATVTMRNAFLRVPPEHEYATTTVTHTEYDRFGIIRSHQPTYARGGQDREVLHIFCIEDEDCGNGGACDTDRNICVGGLTEDRGQTDFLSFYASRQNLYADSLTDEACVSDWECDGRYLTCESADDQETCEDNLLARDGSVCDPAARRCTIPLRDRPIRPVQYRLSPGYPGYLVRPTMEAIAQWNEALMRGRRAVEGRLPIDQIACDASQEEDEEDPDQRKGDGICTTNLQDVGKVACQDENPADFCYCGSAEDIDGGCFRAYDPFETPEQAENRGVPNPYDCYIDGPDEPEGPEAYEDYEAESYEYTFVGEECILTAVANSCDLDPEAPCEELGDLRHQFLVHIQHGGVAFGGVSQPLSDPTNGELIVSNASVSGESMESIATTTTQFLPVLRGETPEDDYFSGENVRGYFGRLGLVEHPSSTVPSGTDGYTVADVSRPSDSFERESNFNLADRASRFGQLDERMQALAPKMEQLFGQEGRAAILSDRIHELKGTDVQARLDAVLRADASPVSSSLSDDDEPASGLSLVEDGPLDRVLRERLQQQAMAANFMDDFEPRLFNNQYWQFWADLLEPFSPAEASIRMQQVYYRSIMVHEIGHSLGLNHNFAGSLDRDHYHDPYFAMAREMPLPGYLEYDSPARGGDDDGDITGPEAQRWEEDLRWTRQQRLAQGAGNVMTSSVMDYDGDLSGLAGMGRYDAAAVMFSYFDRIEAYDTPSPTSFSGEISAEAANSLGLQGLEHADSHRRELWTYYRGGQTCQSNRDCPHSSGRETTAFQPITQRCVNNSRTPNTTGNCGDGGCVCSNFHDDFQAYLSGRAYTTDDPEYAPVDYLYCNDNRQNDLSWCTTFDAGESFQEVVDHYRLGWVQRYPNVYFRNYDRLGPRKGYSQNTVVDAVKIFQHLFFRFNFEGNDFRNSIGPLGYADQLFASADVFNWLGEIIAMPDVGSYALDDEAGVYRQIAGQPGAPGSDLDLLPGQGFYLWSEYQEGLNGFYRLERAGTFLDKLLAIEAIAQRDWGLSFTIDERYYINFYDLFDVEVIDLFGGLILRNPKAYAPRVMDMSDPDEPRIAYLSHYRSGDRGSNEDTYSMPAIDGTDSEVLRDSAAIQALATFPIFYDTSFEQRLLVFKTGSGDGYDIPAERSDGTPTCEHGADGCEEPDFIVYDSDRLHTSYVAVVIQPNAETGIDEQQLGFQLLLRLKNTQQELRALQAIEDPSAAEQDRIIELRLEIERDESFVEYLIELGRLFGISSYLY